MKVRNNFFNLQEKNQNVKYINIFKTQIGAIFLKSALAKLYYQIPIQNLVLLLRRINIIILKLKRLSSLLRKFNGAFAKNLKELVN